MQLKSNDWVSEIYVLIQMSSVLLDFMQLIQITVDEFTLTLIKFITHPNNWDLAWK